MNESLGKITKPCPKAWWASFGLAGRIDISCAFFNALLILQGQILLEQFLVRQLFAFVLQHAIFLGEYSF